MARRAGKSRRATAPRASAQASKTVPKQAVQLDTPVCASSIGVYLVTRQTSKDEPGTNQCAPKDLRTSGDARMALQFSCPQCRQVHKNFLYTLSGRAGHTTSTSVAGKKRPGPRSPVGLHYQGWGSPALSLGTPHHASAPSPLADSPACIPPYTSASACLPLLPSARPFPSHTSSLRASFLYVSPASQEMPQEALLPVSPTAGPSYPQRETALNNIVEGIIRVTQKKWPHNCALPQLHLRTCRCLRRRQGSHHRDHPRGSRRLDRHAAHPAPLARP